MARRRLRLLAGLALAAALPGAAAAGVAIEEQRTALLECKRQQGVPGAAWFHQTRRTASPSQMAVQIVPYDRVDPAAAAAINACGASRLGLAPATGASRAATGRTIVRSIRAPGGYRGIDCGRNPTILYRGDYYCQRR